MTSKTLNNNSTLGKTLSVMWWTIKKYKYTLIIYSIILFLTFPMVSVFYAVNNMSMSFDKTTFEFSLYNTLFAAAGIIFSVVISFINFSYMQKKTSVDWYFSFPMSRRSMFASKYLASLVMSIVPILFMTLLGALIRLYQVNFYVLFTSFMMLVLAIVSNISFAALLSVCCGTTVDAIISYCVISIIYPMAWGLIYFLPDMILPGYVSNNISVTLITALVPFVSQFAGIYAYMDSSDYSMYQTIHIVWWLIFIVLCMVGSFLLIRKRRAEMAQNAFAFSIPSFIIKVFAAVVSGIGLGLIFNSMGVKLDLFYLWFVLGAAIGVFSCNFFLHIIYFRGAKGFLKNLIQAAVSFVIVCVIYFSVITGGFGYVSRVPDVEDIQGVKIHMEDTHGSYSYYTDNRFGTEAGVYFEDENIIKTVQSTHKGIVDNLNSVYGFPYNLNKQEKMGEAQDKDARFYSFRIDYTLKNGSHLVREYQRGEIPPFAQDVLEKIMTSSDYKKELAGNFFSEDVRLETIEYYSADTSMVITSSDADFTPFLEALKKDFESAPYVEFDYMNTGRLDLTAIDNGGRRVRFNLNIDENYENTLKELEKLKKETVR